MESHHLILYINRFKSYICTLYSLLPTQFQKVLGTNCDHMTKKLFSFNCKL